VGFHPAGGGEVVMTTLPSQPLAPLHLPPSSGELDLSMFAIVSSLPEGIARRELTTVLEALPGERAALHSATVHSPGPGNALWLSARDRQTGVCNVFSGIGEPGLSAEDVGTEVARAFLAHRASGTSVETHLADQLMLPIAVAGEGSFTCHELSLHSRTNIEVIHAFTGRRLRAWQLATGCYRIVLEA
jgi:RNA 3'-terminal phosphate cyclase (ATP)